MTEEEKTIAVFYAIVITFIVYYCVVGYLRSTRDNDSHDSS